MIRAACLVYIALILIVPSASRTFAAQPSPDVPPLSRLPRSISSRSVSMYARARILVLDATRDEVELSKTQAQQVDDLLREWSAFEEESNRKVTSLRGQNSTRNTARSEGTQAYLERLQKLLTTEQNAHLNRLALKAIGLSVFIIRGPIAARVELSDEQQQQVRAIARDRGASTESQLTRFLEILTPEQRGIWDELAGKDFALPERTRGRGRVAVRTTPNIRAPAAFLRKVWVQRDLKLTTERAAEIDSLFAALASRLLGIQEQMIAGAQGEAWQEEIEKLRKSTDETSENLLAAISAPQLKRLDQLVLQSDSVLVFRSPDVHKRLDLNPQQISTIAKFLREFQDFARTKPKGGSGDEAKWLEQILLKREQLLKDALLLLTPEQLKKWEEFVGPLADQSPDARIK